MKNLSASLIVLFFLNAGYLFAVPVKKSTETAKSAVTAVSNEAPGYLDAELSGLQSPVVPSAPSLPGTITRLFFSLLVVILVIYLAMVALKYFYVRASIPLKSEGVVKILAKEYIDTKKAIYFIEAADRILILGSAGENLNTLAEITDRETIEKVRQQADEYIAKYRVKSESNFSDQLKAGYVKQGKKLVDAGNDAVKKLLGKFRKKQ